MVVNPDLAERYEQMFLAVRSAINKLNPFNILEEGMPIDEFDSETASIVAGLRNVKSEEDVAQLCADVLNKAFDTDYNKQSLNEMAKNLYAKLKEVGGIYPK